MLIRSSQLAVPALILTALACRAWAQAPAGVPVVRAATSTSQIQAAGDAPQVARQPKDRAFRHADLERARHMKISMSSTSDADSSATPQAGGGRRLAPDAACTPGGTGAGTNAPCPSPRPSAINLPRGMTLGGGGGSCASSPPQPTGRASTLDDALARGGSAPAAGADQRGANNVIAPALIGAAPDAKAARAGAASSATRPGALVGPHAPRARASANAVPN